MPTKNITTAEFPKITSPPKVFVHLRISKIEIGKHFARVFCVGHDKGFVLAGEEHVNKFKEIFKVGNYVNIIASGEERIILRINKGIDLEV